MTVRALSARYADGFVLGRHAHDWHQLLHASEGVMTVEAGTSTWVVPPHRAVWLPAGVEHRVTMRGQVAMKTLYFAHRARAPLRTTCVVNVPPLLRELVLHTSRLGKLDRDVPHEARLAGLLDDLLRQVEVAPLVLPMPREARARRAAEAMRTDPGASVSSIEVARRAGASLRTLERAFVDDTGLTFGAWRQRARLLSALGMLAAGTPVREVAPAIGYGSVSAFIVGFKRAFGTTPSRYFDEAAARK